MGTYLNLDEETMESLYYIQYRIFQKRRVKETYAEIIKGVVLPLALKLKEDEDSEKEEESRGSEEH